MDWPLPYSAFEEKTYQGYIENRDRDYSMKTMRENGMTYEAIARVFGISKQRVHKIVSQAERNQRYGL